MSNLSDHELEEIKDDVIFKTKTTENIKFIRETIEGLNCVSHASKLDKVSNMVYAIQGQLLVQWAVLFVLIKKVFS